MAIEMHCSNLSKNNIYQIIRYGVVGALSNLTGYAAYLLITWFGLDPKVAVSILYPIAANIAYFGHRKYTFQFRGGHTYGILRYFIAHLLGYLLNLLILFVFVDKLGLPHQAIQFISIFIVAAFLFAAFKFFVFPDKHVSKPLGD